MALFAVFQAQNLDNLVCPVIQNCSYFADSEKNFTALVGRKMHGVIDVNDRHVRKDIFGAIKKRWLCESAFEEFLWINNPLHLSEAIKIYTYDYCYPNITTLRSSVAIITGMPLQESSPVKKMEPSGKDKRDKKGKRV